MGSKKSFRDHSWDAIFYYIFCFTSCAGQASRNNIYIDAVSADFSPYMLAFHCLNTLVLQTAENTAFKTIFIMPFFYKFTAAWKFLLFF